MIKEPRIQIFDLIMSLSRALDLVSPAVVNHHMRVAYIAFCIGKQLNLPAAELRRLVLAGALHDIGAFSLKERIATLQFELENPYQHAEAGFLLLKDYGPFSGAADLVRFHHVPWAEGAGREFNGEKVPKGSHILHLADRVAVLIGKHQEVLGEAARICEMVNGQSGKMFMPELVDAFRELAARESFWLDAASPSPESVLPLRLALPTIELDMEELLHISTLFSHVIDFRSRFTATHSSGVAASAELIAGFIGFSERECRMMRIAGYLHDLGKLAVPAEILEKPSELTKPEFDIIRSHTYYTYRILEPIVDLYEINTWASFHHERLDGSGYPFHHKGRDLPLGSRIMAVADVFTAITEDRPYRKGMPEEKALQVLQRMAEDSALDSNIVSLLRLHFDEINACRMEAQKASEKEYKNFLQPVD
ncbi:MAG TPA: HD domain-containing protein [Thermoanaerobacterales bacterium]|nr:HD domain-containing protein [Thermoanaerobacterales bacterium]